ncbi:iqgap- protein [Coniosporium apollinis]|uniref:Iqgap- protein n=1 Tax=Coniosporium apollinis TaxID=61459 RepID=A0ABQ9NV75_9PEZI|nr:iqgap- protein [Coniosporium apollinis]
MSFQYPSRTVQRHTAASPSPLRHASTVSTGSSDYSNFSHPSRTSTLSSHASNGYVSSASPHRRGGSETTVTAASPTRDRGDYLEPKDVSPSGAYRSTRASLRPLSQAPASSPPPREKSSAYPSHSRSYSVDPVPRPQYGTAASPSPKARPQSTTFTRSDSAVATLSAHTHDPFVDSSNATTLETDDRPAVMPRSDSTRMRAHDIWQSREASQTADLNKSASITLKSRPQSLVLARSDSLRARPPELSHSVEPSLPLRSSEPKPRPHSIAISRSDSVRPTYERSNSLETMQSPQTDGATSPPAKPRPHSLAISRSDSARAPAHDRASRANGNHVHFPAQLDKTDLKTLQKSATGHLRTLSKFSEDGEEDFTIKSRDQEVVGMHGRRRLQRSGSRLNKRAATVGYAGRTWMDTQRQFLQAYEYLCHIGEAKEWIEDIIEQPIPPIVQLEEALRDGVTLAEVVQALHPERPLRIFRHPRLQFRHSDNIALFFRFLAEVELPELFRFELVDLYEKKNIPKVIYCIHALSWLLFRKGIVDFRIGNLVGQLQFEDHELEAMQKGLDKSGVSMPNFSGMSANFGAEPEPEPEPVETEEERIGRELAENEGSIVDLQTQIRGAMTRIKCGEMWNGLCDAEEALVHLQSKIRGDFIREVIRYRLDMKKFAVSIQSLSRGYLVRSKRKEKKAYWKNREQDVVLLQSLVRARKARQETQFIKSRIQRQEHGIRDLQALFRGVLKRWDVGDKYFETREAEPEVLELQSAIRGALARKKVGEQLAETRQVQAEAAVCDLQSAIRAAFVRKELKEQKSEAIRSGKQVQLFQAAVRGMLQRQAYRTDNESLRQHHSTVSFLQAAARGAIARQHDAQIRQSLEIPTVQWKSLQSHARGMKVREWHGELLRQLRAHSPGMTDFQAIARGLRIRNETAAIMSALREHEASILELQSRIRGQLLRHKHIATLKALDRQTSSILNFQSWARGSMQRQRTYELLCELQDHEPEIVSLQSAARSALLKREIGTLLMQVETEEEAIIDLQALSRGKLIRHRFAEKQKHYKENMEKVIKIQSFIRGRQQGEAYKSLTSGKNPPVGTIKNFVHLLNDSDFDFDEEIEFERLRKTVVQHVRQNELAEQYIDQLDIKIALLVKNKITLDEVVKHQRHFGGHVGSLLQNKEIASANAFDLKALNKNSRKKLEHYQELFFMLQTQPQYLARLFKRIREQVTAEKECKRIELLMMGLFGFAQKRREEYYLLKLISRAIKEEVDSCSSLQDYLRGNFFWSKILNNYIRSPRDRKFLKDLLGPLIKENIIENEGLDLESDPMQIYRSSINNEELRTGQRSRRNPDVPREEAIRDPETRETFIRHLQDLRDIADLFFASMEDLLHRMPYGVRFVAQQTFEFLRGKFPREDQHYLLQVVGHWVWKTYLQPALTQPETWGVVDRGLSPLHKRNLGEVGKVLGQVAAGKLFGGSGGNDIYLQPLNPYLSEAFGRMEDIWKTLINVPDAERKFDIEEFTDLYARTKPTLYIKLTDIFAIHQLIATDISHLCPTQDDSLRELIRELGSAAANESEMHGVGATEIRLQLSPKLHDLDDPEAPLKALFMETKRCVLYIIRVQTGSNLLDIMVRPITPDDEDRWDALVHDELDAHSTTGATKPRGAYMADHTALLDITGLSYPDLKRTCLENILALESAGRITRANHYQDLLNSIAIDIRTKHRRRIQRARELEGVKATLGNLNEKASWLDQQLKSYNDYIEQAMVTLQNKKGKKRFLIPFSMQYNHERELARSGRVPKFGSFKYSARTLAEKGVLVAWTGYAERQWDKVNLTISSDEVGVFHIEGSVGSCMIPGASAAVPLDDLLQAQFNNCQFMNLFGEGALRLNVNLFLHLVFKKFYRDE